MDGAGNIDRAAPPHRTLKAFLAYLIGRLDLYLRLKQGIVEYSDSPDCVFRLQLVESSIPFVLPDGTSVHVGDRLVDLHVWNEHVPLIGKSGPTVAFARRLDRCINASLSELSRYFSERQDLSDVKAIRGNLVFGSKERCGQIARVAARYGFERVLANGHLSFGERLHRLGENILISMLVFVRNPRSLRADTLQRDRTLTYLSRRTLEQRYDSRTKPRAPAKRSSSDRVGFVARLHEPRTT